NFFKLFEQTDSLLYGFFDYLAHGPAVINQRLLLEIADGITGRDHRLTVKVFINSCKDAQQRGLTRAIQADDANLCAVKIGEIDIFENRLFIIELTDADHGIDDFVIGGHNLNPQITQISRDEKGRTKV